MGADNNLLLGYRAGYSLTGGDNNIVIGYDVDIASTTGSNQLNIGNLIFGSNVNGSGTTLSSGNIGIGTSSPASKLDVWGNFQAGTNAVNSSPALFVDATNGRVGVNTTSVNSALQLQVTDNTGGTAGLIRSDATITTDEILGTLRFGGTDGSVYGATRISSYAAESFTGAANGAYLAFLTTPIGSVTAAEVMRLTAAGNIGIGTTSPTSKLDVWGDLRVGTGTVPALLVNNNNSFVGIGTTTPNAPLSIWTSATNNFTFNPSANTANSIAHLFYFTRSVFATFIYYFLVIIINFV